MTKKHAELLAIAFFAIMIVVVFQQIATSMTEQGIASGSPYDNAAAYPKAVALFMGALLVLAGFATWRHASNATILSFGHMRCPAALIAIFGVYLFALGTLGYHLSTTPMLVAMLWFAGYRRPVSAVMYAICLSFGAAFVFEVFLKIVLPGGIWHLNIPW